MTAQGARYIGGAHFQGSVESLEPDSLFGRGHVLTDLDVYFSLRRCVICSPRTDAKFRVPTEMVDQYADSTPIPAD